MKAVVFWRLGMAILWLICVVAALLSLVWMFLGILFKAPRVWSILLAYDQLGNALTGGDEDDVISARCWAQRTRQPYKLLRAAIDWVASQLGEPDHCHAAWETEQAKLRRRLAETGC